MEKIIYSVLFTLITCNCFGQETITGTILGKKSNLPLVYAHIINKNKGKATITNEDGKFELKCSKQDTIIISYLSYERKKIPASYFFSNSTYYLKPIVNDLQTVKIFAKSKNFILDLLFAAKEKMAKSKEQNSKVYFTLKSSSNDSPSELIEAYYNGKIKPSGFGDLEMKNGRLGVAKSDNNYHVSLSTTSIISNYNVLKKSRIFPVIKKDPKKLTAEDIKRIPALPINPLQLSRKQIKNQYNYAIISKKGSVYEIEFKAQNNANVNEFFDAIIGIDRKSEQITSLELSKKNIKHPPFYEINDSKIDSLAFNLNYYFDNSTNNFLTKVLFDYSFSYKAFKKQIKSKGVFLFYDKENLFDLPLYSTTLKLLSDYRKIVHRPFDYLFWKHNKEVILPSKKSQDYKAFFSKNGILLNFKDFDFSNHPLLKENSFEWSKKRKISYYSMDHREYNFRNYDNIKTTSFNFNLSYQLFLDRNTFNDSTYYKTQTIINLHESFYYLKKNRFTSCFINIYFDLVEIARRNMVSDLNKKEWTKLESDSIFKSTLSNLDTDLKEYLKRVNLGNNSKELYIYINKVKDILDVDNTYLIGDTYPIKVYGSNAKLNYGVRLLRSKKYKEAIDYFKKHEDLGEKHPWIYYNIGLAYLYLKEKKTACLYFKKSIQLGQQIDPEISRQCDLLEEAKN